MRMFYRSTLAACLALITSCFAVSALADTPTKESIEKSVQRTLEEFKVPGMTVAVVYKGEIFYSAGHGIRETGSEARVDDQTLFQIASVSKAFTAAALAVLVDDGKVGWDEPVIDYLPEFRMYDPWVTREFTVRDLLTHRSGLPLGAGDLLLFPEANSTRDEVIRAMRHLKPASSFRSEFAYDNLLYIIAGEIVGRVSDSSFEDFVETRLLMPLGMKGCTATLGRASGNKNKATPHVMVDGELETTLSLESTTAAAAGGVTCNARGMAKWAAFILSNGLNADGEQIISQEQMAQLLRPVTLTPGSGYVAEHTGAFLSAYALGWGVSTFYGQPSLSHTGGLWGMTSYIIVLPEQELAVFVSNNLLSAAPRAIGNDIVDQFLQGVSESAGKDWITIVADASNTRRNAGAEAIAEASEARAVDSKPSLPTDAYVGTYRDPWYGDVEISNDENGGLYFASGRSERLSGPLEHFQYDTFIARWKARNLNADAYVSFTLSPDGGVERIRMKAVSPTTDFSFDFHDLDLERVPSD